LRIRRPRRSPTVYSSAASDVNQRLGEAEIIWLEKNYDFGVMKEEGGPVKGSARFINKGKEPVVVTGARPSCGCTGVEYSEEPVNPGDTAVINFTYDPTGRPGKFEKTIRVYIGESDTYRIGITGSVLGTPESLRQFYPYEIGPLYVSDTMINGGDLTPPYSKSSFIRCYNSSLNTISPKAVCENPMLTVRCNDTKIGPGDITVFSMFINPGKIKEMGDVEIPFTIIANSDDPDSPRQQVTYKANVSPDFSNLTSQQVSSGPRCYLIPERLDLGIVSGSVIKPASLKIQNQGKGKMSVLKVSPKSDAIVIKRIPKSVKPGKTEEATLSILVDKIPEGVFRLPVEIYTDDPLHPQKTFYLVGIKE
ncbi:MAG: DUF1573 domain-containing protein, partial [Muribaculaceae bacterium]|nr:DUF1573 domain-containing protein [Muribaculaceae bacterium]